MAKAIAGGQVTKTIKASTLGEKVSTFAKSSRTGQAALRAKAPYDRGKARVATGLARASGKAAGPLLRQAKSAGATYRLWRLQRQTDLDVNDLSEVERKRASAFLARNGEDGAEFLNRLDSETTKDFLSVGRRCAVSRTAVSTQSCNSDLDDDEWNEWGTIVRESDILRQTDHIETIRSLSGEKQTRAVRLVNRHGDSGIRFLDDLGDTRRQRVLALDGDGDNVDGFDDWADWRDSLVVRNSHTSTTSLSQDDVNGYIDTMYEISQRKNVEGHESLFRDVRYMPNTPEPNRFREIKFEADVTNDYAQRNRIETVIVEPGKGDRIDLKIIRDQKGVQYIEIKSISGKLNKQGLDKNIVTKDGSINDKFRETEMDVPDGGRVGMVGISKWSKKIRDKKELKVAISEIIVEYEELLIDRIVVELPNGKKINGQITNTGVEWDD